MTLELWEFQQEDHDKLSHNTSNLIGSDMGAGKTISAVALDVSHRHLNQSGKTLVVAPLPTLVSTWQKHFEQYTDLKVSVCNNKKRTAFLDIEADVYICHYEALRLLVKERPEFAKQQWLHIIADECHRISNRKAQQTKALKALKTAYKTGLSGTYITNKPGQEWSVLNWLYPKEYTSFHRHFQRYVYYTMSPDGYPIILGPANTDELLERIQPFYVRHLKKEQCCPHHPNGVMPFLPDKYYSELTAELLPEQRRAYNEMRKETIAWVGAQGDEPVVAPIAIARMARLSQFACAYARVDDTGNVRLSEPSGKLDCVLELLNDSEEQIVIFSQFKQLIGLLCNRLKDAGITYARYTGDEAQVTRTANVKKFQSGEARIFAGTVTAGGVGLDGLQDAGSTVIFLDRTWSPALNLQAEDRLWRPGQKNKVHVIDVIAANTVDRGRQQQLGKKWQDIREILGDSKKV